VVWTGERLTFPSPHGAPISIDHKKTRVLLTPLRRDLEFSAFRPGQGIPL
jgi:hypothetical protein